MRITKFKGRVRRLLHSFAAESSLRLFAHFLWMKIFLRSAKGQAPSESAQVSAPTRGIEPYPSIPGRTTIPKIIFQTWKSKEHIPKNFKHWSGTFKQLNPEYQYVLWEDFDNRQFIATRFAWFLPFYDWYPREIFRADIVRLFFLYTFGGLYADMDTECLRPLRDSLDGPQVILGRMGTDPNFPHSIPNAMMASVPHQLFWLLAISMAIERLHESESTKRPGAEGPEYLTGPILIREALTFYEKSGESAVRARASSVINWVGQTSDIEAGAVRLLDAHQWYPIDWNNRIHQAFRGEMMGKRYIPSPRVARLLFPRSQLVTYWTHSW